MSDYSNDGLTAIDNIMAQTAFAIGPIIYRDSLPTATWEAIIPRSELPEEVGDSLSTTIYDRSVPTMTEGGLAVGVNWARAGGSILSANAFGPTEGVNIAGAMQEVAGPTAGNHTAFLKFRKRMRNYFLSIANVKSPLIPLHSVRTATARDQQLGIIQNIMMEASKWVWARRHETEFERNAGNFVPCMAAITSPSLEVVDLVNTSIDSSTGIVDADALANNPFFGSNLTDLNLLTTGVGNSNVVPTGFLSNAVLNRLYQRLVRTTDHAKAYGSTNGRPVFCLRIGADASDALIRDTGVRDDVRESTWVDELLKPIGVDRSWRGFYHMVDDLIPRYTEAGGVLTRVEPFDSNGIYNAAYDNADYEVFYIVQKEVMECQVPGATVSGPGVSYGVQENRGKFDWLNIQHLASNPRREVGLFYASFASASKPIKPLNGYVGLFKRTASTPAL
jgi:hypothetical protein